jgi:hypothetical protein
MAHVMKVIGLASGDWRAPETLYLKSYDVDANDGRGDAELTPNIHEALEFDDAVAAMQAWREQSTVQPLRLDGKPNRPLTAFTVQIERKPDANEG